MAATIEPVVVKNMRIGVEIWTRFQHLYEGTGRTQRDCTEDALSYWCDREERRIVAEQESSA